MQECLHTVHNTQQCKQDHIAVEAQIDEDFTDMSIFSITSEDIFVHNPYWKCRWTATWHRSNTAVWQKAAVHFVVIRIHHYRCYGAVLTCNGQEDAAVDPSEKGLPFVQWVISWYLVAFRACQIITKQSCCTAKNMSSQAHFTVDKTLSRMSATIGSGWCITLGSERRGLSHSSFSTARLFDCQ